mgnify:CR=1 FL=1|tara:strand:+ start:457 stop:687 length:231 start_codon:yes stop_codon:yes gene_type:complete
MQKNKLNELVQQKQRNTELPHLAYDNGSSKGFGRNSVDLSLGLKNNLAHQINIRNDAFVASRNSKGARNGKHKALY